MVDDDAAWDGAGDDAAPRTYTIDELAAVTGVPSRTIRYYQSKEVLPRPARAGRVAVYSDDHVDRLRTIAGLQDRGLRLDAIRDVLRQVREGSDSLQTWLGISPHLQAPWSDELALVLTEAQLEQRMGGHKPDLVAAMLGVGTIFRSGTDDPPTYIVASPALLEIVTRLDAAGLHLGVLFGAGEIIRRNMARTAQQLLDFFLSRAGEGFSDEVDGMTQQLDALRPVGAEAARVIFAQEMERTLRLFVEHGGIEAFTLERANRMAREDDGPGGEAGLSGSVGAG